jgi:hypothetical protein
MDDFQSFLQEIGLTSAQMDAAAKAMPAPLPNPGEPYEVRPSPIHGVGCFATAPVMGRLCTLRIGPDWLEAGRYINHSPTPNAKAVKEWETIRACGTVAEGDEITLDYRQVLACMLGEDHG